MSEEFEESEVIFEEYKVEDEDRSMKAYNFELNSRESRNKRKNLETNNTIKSMPGGDDGEMVPPHVIVGRRVAAKTMAFSVCTGIGRTLKGRDLSEVRNSVLRMTGFLET
ncbi:hypothetical protein PHJA_001823700 [Phtheirospermum japonicum]|uniref:Senescence regulator S40 n=1 Tax=Phtheirospermum japonicum TaxID=374723 RepID=A0A830CC68_9LAMI|nr:hypothetical protein PHJA_001823700 [Phtheirospermum japonicum]